MPRLMLFPLLACVAALHSAQAAEYYVSNAGSDTSDGSTLQTAWQSLDPVNTTPGQGDTVLFRRGDLFRGTVTVRAADMTFGAYGEGPAPVISGSALITGWSPHAGDIYVAATDQPIVHLFVNGELMTIARYPNSGWLRTDAGVGAAGFEDAALTAHPQLPLCHTEEIWIRNGVRVNPKKKHRKRGGYIFPYCLPLCVISPSSTVLRRDLLDEIGLFDGDPGGDQVSVPVVDVLVQRFDRAYLGGRQQIPACQLGSQLAGQFIDPGGDLIAV